MKIYIFLSIYIYRERDINIYIYMGMGQIHIHLSDRPPGECYGAAPAATIHRGRTRGTVPAAKGLSQIGLDFKVVSTGFVQFKGL